MKQRALWDERHRREDTYSYAINTGGELHGVRGGEVQIRFVNGRFDSAEVPFSGQWSRGEWHVLRGVADQIEALESRIASENAPRATPDSAVPDPAGSPPTEENT